MIKSLLNGIGFGFGFCLAVALVLWVASQFENFTGVTMSDPPSDQEIHWKEKNKFRDLTIEEKINKSTSIAIIRFKKEEDDLNAAYVEDIKFRDPNAKLNIKRGDRIQSADFYSQGETNRDRNGVVIFFARNPGLEIGQSYLYEDRMIGEGDMPLELFLRKYNESKI